MITEAGGLIGNFTGEADFLYQREVVAGNPKVYGQLVPLLAPYTRVIKAEEPAPPNRPTEASPEAALAATQPAEPAPKEAPGAHPQARGQRRAALSRGHSVRNTVDACRQTPRWRATRR